MPQTVEHLAILDLLEVKGGVVALTKIDLVDDPDWLELVMLDVEESLSDTFLADSPIVPVSSRNGDGIEAVQDAIYEQLQDIEPKPDIGRPRLPIDRVFSLPGFGTIVTGTLSGGHLDIGDLIEIQPGDRQARIRGLQSHQNKLERALPGSRVAVNLTGLRKGDPIRGDVLASPGVVSTTILCDVKYRHLSNDPIPLKHNTAVKMFIGSAEVMARTRVLKSKQIDPGDSGWLQLELEQPIAVVRGDKFILRRPSPPLTLGGGHVLDPHPGRKHRRFRTDIEQRLEMLDKGSPEDLLLEAIYRYQPSKLSQLKSLIDLSNEEIEIAYGSLLESAKAELLEDYVLPPGGLDLWKDRIETILDRFHAESSLRPGLPREELRNRLGVPADFFNKLVLWAEQEHVLVPSGTIIRKSDHEISFSKTQENEISRLTSKMARAGVNSPSVKDCKAAVGDDVYYALVDLGKLMQISSDVVYTSIIYTDLVARITDYLHQNQTIDVAKLRDLLGTSRKYAIALLEHLDDTRVTKRVGDNRELV